MMTVATGSAMIVKLRMYVSVWYRNGNITDITSITKLVHLDENSQAYSLVRTYYTHNPHQDFKRIFYHLFGKL